ncbi:MAG: Wzz/FepE/Etk N-terminal domain-containing protein [Gammaproteobacteria bacterium]
MHSEHASPGDEGSVELIDVVQGAWRYKLLIGGVTLAAIAIAIYLAMTAPLIYRAEVVVTPVREGGPGSTASSLLGQFGGLASLAGINLGANTGVGPEAQALLESRRLIEEFVRRNKLVPVLFPHSSPPPSLWLAVRDFRKDVVTVQLDKRTGITTVSVEWTDPRTAATWANGLVALANELLRARALESASRNIEFLHKQIAQTNVLELQHVMYNIIETETKTLMLANARAEYAFMVVDPAVAPEERSSPRRAVMVVTGAALGFIGGSLLAFLHNALSRRRRQSQKPGS